jgi:tetratricopeptide (TPR) repeat protein
VSVRKYFFCCRVYLECLRIISTESADYSKELRAYLHHQLAVVYFSRGVDSRGMKKDSNFLTKALVCAKKAVASQQENTEYWNTVGVCAFCKIINYSLTMLSLRFVRIWNFLLTILAVCDNDELAQHCFVKSVTLNGTNATAWTNLGFMYLKYGEPAKANQIFGRSQSSQPLYPYAWTGQVCV